MDLVAALAMRPRELVAFVGGGGKTTLLVALGRQLEEAGASVILTTTTKMGLEQTEGRLLCWSPDPPAIDRALDSSASVMVLSDADDHKVVGFPPESVDEWFVRTQADYVLVEADGARRRPLKAPADHEPVVPAATTLAVIVMGIDAIGRPVSEVAHRPEGVEALTGAAATEIVTAEMAAYVVGHADGGRKGIPTTARIVVALTKVGPQAQAQAEAVRLSLTRSPAIDRVIVVPFEAPAARL